MLLRYCVFLTFAMLCMPLLAADEPAAEAHRGPKAEEFYRLQGEMNDLIAKFAVLQMKYRIASNEQRDQILLQWKEYLAQGEAIEPKLIEAAKDAFIESPQGDREIATFLYLFMVQCIQQDRYEQAYEIGQMLMENNIYEKHTANLAGIAAFATNHYDDAERYLIAAAEGGYFKTPPKENSFAEMGIKCLQGLENYKKAWPREEALRAREEKADNLPRVLLKTSKGDITLELFENEAPNTVANFISLVENGFYDSLTFHRVMPSFMAQGGDPLGNGAGGPGYSIACECFKPNHRDHFRGSLSMAHKGRDTGGSQFFLTFTPRPNLNEKHTVFGRVIDGMDVLSQLQRRKPDDKEPALPDKIIKAEMIRKRPHEYEPVKMPR